LKEYYIPALANTPLEDSNSRKTPGALWRGIRRKLLSHKVFRNADEFVYDTDGIATGGQMSGIRDAV